MSSITEEEKNLRSSPADLRVNTQVPLSGDAVNSDGTLKDASEIRWVHSPSELTPPPLEKRVLENENDDGDSDGDLLPKRRRVSCSSCLHCR